jgi:hypothetical protein
VWTCTPTRSLRWPTPSSSGLIRGHQPRHDQIDPSGPHRRLSWWCEHPGRRAEDRDDAVCRSGRLHQACHGARSGGPARAPRTLLRSREARPRATWGHRREVHRRRCDGRLRRPGRPWRRPGPGGGRGPRGRRTGLRAGRRARGARRHRDWRDPLHDRGRRPPGHRRGSERGGPPPAGRPARRSPGRRARRTGLPARPAGGQRRGRGQGDSRAARCLPGPRGRARGRAVRHPADRQGRRPRHAQADRSARRPRAPAPARYRDRRGRDRQDPPGRRAVQGAALRPRSLADDGGPQSSLRRGDRVLGARGDPA